MNGGMDIVPQTVAILLVASCAMGVAVRLPRRRVAPWCASAWLLASAAAFAAQLRHPALLPAFQRDAAAVARGDWYRLVTALLFEDGGVPGAALNALLLLLVGAVAEMTLGRRRWIVIACAGAVAGELAGLAWAPVGAGPSVAIMGLCGGLLAAGWARCPGAGRPVAMLGLAIAVMSTAARDIHGLAALAGALAWSLENRLARRWPRYEGIGRAASRTAGWRSPP